MAERRLIGRLKKFRSLTLKIFSILLALFLCLPFVVFEKEKPVAVADSTTQTDIKNINKLDINLSSNAKYEVNRTLIKKGTSTFLEGNVYAVINQNSKNQTMKFNVSKQEINENQSLFVWLFISDLMVNDLSVVAKDSDNNSLCWKLQGVEFVAEEDYQASLYDMIVDYGGKISKGWKLLELNFDEAEFSQNKPSIISTLEITYGFVDNSEVGDDAEAAIAYPFIADKYSDKSAIVDHQNYVVYAEKDNFLKNMSNIYMGDKIVINNVKELFSYVVVGNQNVLDDSAGFVWNAMLNYPNDSKPAKLLSFDRAIEIIFETEGYYSLDVELMTSDQDVYAIISEDYLFAVEEFQFGYFQKYEYAFKNGTQNMISFNLSADFEFCDNETLQIEVSDKNIVSAAYYYIDDNKININLTALGEGTVLIKVKAVGTKVNEIEPKTFEQEIKVTVFSEKQNNDNIAIWIVFGILMTSFVVYLIILFVKSRRFGVK